MTGKRANTWSQDREGGGTAERKAARGRPDKKDVGSHVEYKKAKKCGRRGSVPRLAAGTGDVEEGRGRVARW